VNPGFVSDCLETLEEIAVLNRRIFLQLGGERFSHVPCLNDSPAGMRVITAIVVRELQGWI
jgi:ferrochelatase